MKPHHRDDEVTVYHGDCLAVMAELPAESVDAIVTDPPYGLEFMGKEWDAPWRESDVNNDAGFNGGGMRQAKNLPSFTGSSNPKCSRCKGTRRGRRDGTAKVPVCLCDDGGRFPNVRAVEMRAFQEWCEAWVAECLRVLKPGGYILAFGGSRTWHRLAVAIEDAGFELRDSIAWLYGSGFPKSLDISKAIDKQRHDRGDVLIVTAWIAEQRDRAGLTSRQIDEAFGLNGMAGHWTSQKSQPLVPTLEQVPLLLATLGVADDQVPENIRRLLFDLNGRKGQPGEAWLQREVLSTSTKTISDRGSWAAEVGHGMFRPGEKVVNVTAPTTEAAQQWAGWGTALKPAFEPIVVGRKPMVGTTAVNVLAYGVGALNVDGCRVHTEGSEGKEYTVKRLKPGAEMNRTGGNWRPEDGVEYQGKTADGRWPTNVLLDESQAAALDKQSGVLTSGKMTPVQDGAKRQGAAFGMFSARTPTGTYGDSGGASRFFPTFRYEAKAPTSERPNVDGAQHPTVKPVDLMRWLVRLVTPSGGLVLDPFAGSGTTAEACIHEHMRCITIERDEQYLPLIVARLTKPIEVGFDFGGLS